MSILNDASSGDARWFHRLPSPARAALAVRLRDVILFGMIPALTLVNAGVGLLVPMMLSPEDFGRYAVIVTLFQYGLIFDLGLGQVTDRHVPALTAPGQKCKRDQLIGRVLWMRLIVAAVTIGCGSVVIMALDATGRLELQPLACELSLLSGILFMLGLGPATVLRASSQRRIFGILSVLLMLVLAVGRVAGLAMGGIVGCFAALTIGYGVLAVVFQSRMMPQPAHLPSLRDGLTLVLEGFPLFLVSFAWAFYMTANRWVVSTMASDTEVGHFAFGANIVALVVGAVASLGQFYYPRIVMHHSTGEPFCISGRLRRDLGLLLLASTVPVIVGLFVGPAFVRIVYPKFLDSVPLLLQLALAIPVLSVSSWLMPVALSTSARPWLDGILIYPLVIGILIIGTGWGFSTGGISGAAWGLLSSALPLLALQLATLLRARVLLLRDGALLLGFGLLSTITLAAVSML